MIDISKFNTESFGWLSVLKTDSDVNYRYGMDGMVSALNDMGLPWSRC